MPIKFNRILWLLPNKSLFLFSSIVKGLELLGATVMLVDYREDVLCLGFSGVRNKIKNTVDEFKPDLILASFFGDTHELSPEFLRDISSKVPLVIWGPDDTTYEAWQSIGFAQSADAMLVSDYYEQFKYQQLSMPTVHYWMIGLDFVLPLPKNKKDFDVSFVGDCLKADRIEYLEFLRDNGINVAVYGRGSENGFVSRMELLDIISRSKISLNFAKIEVLKNILNENPWRAYVGQVKGRPFEVAQMKSFCLSEFSEDVELAFEIGSEMDVFHDKEELLEKIKYYLANDSERETMAAKSYEKSENEYGSLEYLSRSFDLLHEKLQNNSGRIKSRPVFRNFDFNASEVKANFLIFIKLLRLRRFAIAFDAVPYFFKVKLSFLVGLWSGVVELVSQRFIGRK
jgi:spore maturation protein CgeB